MKILITGAAGFIGFHLSQKLLKQDYQIIGIDNLNDYYDPSLKQSRLEILGKYNNFNFHKADLKNKAEVDNIFETYQPTHVINLAAQAGVRYSIENPYAYVDSNLIGFMNILEACRNYPVDHLLYASSSSVYGGNKVAPFSTNHNVDHPVSLYAATKKANELMAHSYSHLYQLPTTGLRFFTVYGPRQRPDLAIHKFTKLISEGKTIPFYGDGTTCRDYTYIDDIVDGIEKAFDYVSENNLYEIFNLGESKTITLKEMVQTIEKCLQKKARLELLPMQPGDVIQTYADISKSKKMLGYNPQTNFENGVERFVEWYKHEN